MRKGVAQVVVAVILAGLVLSLAGGALTLLLGQQQNITEMLLGAGKETQRIESVTCNGPRLSILVNNTGTTIPGGTIRRVRVYEGGDINYSLQVDSPDVAGDYPDPYDTGYLNVSTGAVFQPGETYSLEVKHQDGDYSFESQCRTGLDWWDLGWTYRRQVVVDNTADVAKDAASTTASVSVDTAALQSADKLLENCGDLRVVERQTVRPYEVTDCGTSSTTVRFNTSVAASAREYDVYLYYGNIRATQKDTGLPSPDPDLATRLRTEERR